MWLLYANKLSPAYRAGGAKGGVTYIKISESEIADDYPLPKQYEKPDEETDEVEVFFDEDLVHCDPEYLPRKLLSDFAIYNAEGFMATLELLPLWRGADPDVELYASGVVAEDDGSWQGAHPLIAPPEAPKEDAPGAWWSPSAHVRMLLVHRTRCRGCCRRLQWCWRFQWCRWL